MTGATLLACLASTGWLLPASPPRRSGRPVCVESWYDTGTRLSRDAEGGRITKKKVATKAEAIELIDAGKEDEIDYMSLPDSELEPFQRYVKKAKIVQEKNETGAAFLSWVYQEKAKEMYEEENPVNPLETAQRKLSGPLQYVVIIGAGFYAIPIIQNLARALGLQVGEEAAEVAPEAAEAARAAAEAVSGAIDAGGVFDGAS